MGSGKVEVTIEELEAMLRKTSLPTVLVEGRDDIIFYRSIEEGLQDIGVDMLPAGNKDFVLSLRERLSSGDLKSTVVFIVDKDLWVYPEFSPGRKYEDVIQTSGYSIENDIFEDGGIMELMSATERADFLRELELFVAWYALAIDRRKRGLESPFRSHPGKILDDRAHYAEETALVEGEVYPEELRGLILREYGRLLRGKSLFALLVRVLSSKRRDVKFSVKQLMAIGASRRGDSYARISGEIRQKILGAP
ncbi:DUF4435 domain-containing protein [Stenotrophomonas maltophilia]|uniref:DUF4435 domain-containing protein n=1 Tax=Stenotrophomonas maltophilia TaxID=40324 RepID=UPI00209AC7C8|nr:DUF4435 domain-containing protein [Stenotrophomonas maltophilia]MCO7487341.1 DUF4435 domain-containing protein [Stenotrophomonas maltophilia]